MLSINNSAYHLNKPLGAKTKAPQAQLSTVSDDILFTGKGKSRKRKSIFGLLGLMLAGLGGSFVGASPAQASAPVPDAQQVVIYNGDQACINEEAITHVDKAEQLSALNNARTVDPVIDLCQNPLLSPATQQKLEDFLNDYNFRTEDSPQLAIVTIPDTHNGEIGSLATDLGNQMGIGQDEHDNGMLYLINAQGTRDAESPMMFIAKGNGLDSVIRDKTITDILVQNALPEIKNKNYDAAVENTLNAVTDYLDNPASIQSHSNAEGWNSLSEGEQTAIIVGAIILGLILIMMLALAMESGGYSGGGGGYYSSGSSSSSSGGWSGGFSSGGGGGGSFGGGSFGGGGGGI